MIDVNKLTSKLVEASKPTDVPDGLRTEYDGETVQITTPAMRENVTDFSDIIRDAGYDPTVFSLTAPPVVKTWDAQTPDGVQRLRSFKLTLGQTNGSRCEDVEELIQYVHKPTVPARVQRTNFGVFAMGDLQLGKSDGGGTALVVDRIIESSLRAFQRVKDNNIEHVIVAFLGDCIEGVVSQGGRNIPNNDLPLTDQLRLLRHVMMNVIGMMVNTGAYVTVLSVPGNHDEAYRSPVNAQPRDSFAVDALRAVEEAYTLAGVSSGVDFVYPEGQELHVSFDTGTTRFMFAHGHQWRDGKHFDWWKGHMFNGDPRACADFLIAAHRHHLMVDTESKRTFIQVPAMENRSDWWVNKTGQVGAPGALWLTPNAGGGVNEIGVI